MNEPTKPEKNIYALIDEFSHEYIEFKLMTEEEASVEKAKVDDEIMGSDFVWQILNDKQIFNLLKRLVTIRDTFNGNLFSI